ncbi:hypothetical protein [Aporhodopirellula aestuarii]|uniref:Uncharacterized protein n=1 Tax=Aporhodopirellula aestuarii TaxID=2950107 RepID=A0ABT0TZQ9_9BACT|nr:hypothetical protein [Aporhodopirellula aestuarii]MCM2370065.1 hypothetical protein [Aporhodopirellula aestuarii]
MDTSDGIDFRYEDGVVGVFDPATLPDAKGVLSYLPYRSGSHYAMHQAIGAGETPTCTFIRDGVECSFVVDSCPEYGWLVIRDVRHA